MIYSADASSLGGMNDDKKIEEYSEQELVAELVRRRVARGALDMTAIEDAGEAFAASDSEVLLGAFLDERVAQQDEQPKPCPRCGELCRVRVKHRPRTVRTTLGERTFVRNYHYCESCERGFYPLDIELRLPPEGETSMKLAGRILDFGVTEAFEDASTRWTVHHARPISEHLVRSVVERAGVAVQAAPEEFLLRELSPPPAERSGLLVVQNDGSMVPLRGPDAWKEVKLGVIYREEQHSSGAKTGRGHISRARYVAVLGEQDEFRRALDAALTIEGALGATRVAWVADGAPGNWSLADEICPRAIQILDWCHAVEHGTACGKVLLGESSDAVPVWEQRIKQLLASGDLQTLFDELQACKFAANSAGRDAIDALLRYYRNNERRMHYAAFREEGLPIGSGTVESGHRHVLQKRMKLAGQHWDPVRAKRMATLRAAYKTAGPMRFQSVIASVFDLPLRRAA